MLVGVVWPGWNIYHSSRKLLAVSTQLSAAAKTENLDQIKPELAVSKQSMNDLNGSLNWLIWLRVIPFVGGYYSDAKHFANAASDEMTAAETVVEVLEPYKGELGLTGQAITGQDRVAQMVKIMDKLLPSLDKISPSLQKASNEVAGIDTGKYPGSLAGKSLRPRIEEVRNLIIAANSAVSDNRQLIELLPDALGESKPKTYLLLFQNDKELRATGGFITAYAFLKLDKGHLSTTTSDDIYRLDEQLLKACQTKICPLTPPAPIVKYLPEVDGKPRTAWSLRDSNISPDLPTFAQEFERMYAMLGQGLPFDGIITIDTQVVEELIAATGPIEAGGTTYSAQTDPRCNCPDVIYELEHYAEIASQGEAGRKAILGDLMQQLLAKVLGAGVTKLPEFADVAFNLANDKHIMFYMHNDQLEQALSQLDWTGEIHRTNGDYLHINDSNFAGGKSNLYVDETVTDDISISSGVAKHTLTIKYENPQPFNTWLNGILRDYVRIYVPEGSQLVSSDGSDVIVTTQNDAALGKTYFEAFITVRPQNSRILSFTYTAPVQITGGKYPLLVQRQPGAKDHHYIIKINGSKKAEFDLSADKQLNLSF